MNNNNEDNDAYMINSGGIFNNNNNQNNYINRNINYDMALSHNIMSRPLNMRKEREEAPRRNYMAMSRAPHISAMMMARDEEEDDDLELGNEVENDRMKMNCERMREDSDDDEEDNYKESKVKKKEIEKGSYNDYKMDISKNISEKKEMENGKEKEKVVEFSIKELALTQDIFDGYWNLNPQTKLLIEKEKIKYELIEKLMKEKKLDKEEIIVTLLVLYYLSKNDSINKMEFSLIMKKGINYLEKNGIKFEEIYDKIKN